MKIHNYLSDDDYRLAQERANLRKISKVWVRESTIDAIVARVPAATSVICHGTRNGQNSNSSRLGIQERRSSGPKSQKPRPDSR
jgi:hypothetical protein